MEKCFKCGASGNIVLFDVISEKGIVKVCKRCLVENKFVLVKKPSISMLEELDKKPNKIIPSFQITGKYNYKIEELKNQNLVLKNIANENFKMKIASGKKRKDLVDNFHWIIMRARRLKKLTQKQLGEKIVEPEIAIKMAEQGVVFEKSLYLVEKLERFFGIKIQKEKKQEPIKKNISFDSIYSKNLNISDLRRDSKKTEPYWRNRLFKKQENKIEINLNSENKELSDEEIDELMYGKDRNS